ncbi:MAG: hypothetical protein AB8B97_11755 [Granulosicoccus sp.]
MHRAVLSNQALAQRRGLYEVLSIIGYLVALALCLLCVFNWVENAAFVFFCTAIWALFSVCVVARLWWTNPVNRKERVLEYPETWVDSETTSRNESPAFQNMVAALAEPEPVIETRPAEPFADPAASAEVVSASSFEKIRARAEQLKQYRDARLMRHKQKRSTQRSANRNLSAYLHKL